ncbi:MAG: DeoR/GlpR family DNA-binding transcription regulator [Tepidisphaerales bacterium]
MGRLPRHVTLARRQRLQELLASQHYLPVSRVCELLGVSEATARRDLAALARKRLVRRTHGGALSPYAGDLGDFECFFPAFELRRAQHTAAKSAIADAAVRLLRSGRRLTSGAQLASGRPPRPGTTVFLDAGTTCFAIAEAIEAEFAAGLPVGEPGDPPPRLTVLTNNLAAAIKLSVVPGVDVEVLGGTLLPRQAAIFGDDACRAASGRVIDLAFVGGEGFTADGVWNSQNDVVRLQRAVLAAAERSYFVLDASKLGVSGPMLLSAWAGHGLITDAPARQVQAHGIDLPARRLLVARPDRPPAAP